VKDYLAKTSSKSNEVVEAIYQPAYTTTIIQVIIIVIIFPLFIAVTFSVLPILAIIINFNIFSLLSFIIVCLVIPAFLISYITLSYKFSTKVNQFFVLTDQRLIQIEYLFWSYTIYHYEYDQITNVSVSLLNSEIPLLSVQILGAEHLIFRGLKQEELQFIVDNVTSLPYPSLANYSAKMY